MTRFLRLFQNQQFDYFYNLITSIRCIYRVSAVWKVETDIITSIAASPTLWFLSVTS
jgi:hypothetical protein